MEKLSLVSVVAGYIATLFVHLLSITQLLHLIRQQCQFWYLSRKLEISFGVFVIGLEVRSDLLEPHNQNLLGVDTNQEASGNLWSIIEMLLKAF